MPEYLAPGVFVEETSYRSKSIEGVGTTTTGFVGPCRYGPIDLAPEVVTSVTEFERAYGDRAQLDFGGGAILHNYLWHAVRAFFEEGGKRLYLARAFRPRLDPENLGYKRPTGEIVEGDKGDQASLTDGVYATDGHARLWLTKATAAVAAAEGAVAALATGAHGLLQQVGQASAASDWAAAREGGAHVDDSPLLRVKQVSDALGLSGPAGNETGVRKLLVKAQAKVDAATIAFPTSSIDLTAFTAAADALRTTVDLAQGAVDALALDIVIVPAATKADDAAAAALSAVVALGTAASAVLAQAAASPELKQIAAALRDACAAAAAAAPGGDTWQAFNAAKTATAAAKTAAAAAQANPTKRDDAATAAKAAVVAVRAAQDQRRLAGQGADRVAARALADGVSDAALGDKLTALAAQAVGMKTTADAALQAAQRSDYPRAFAVSEVARESDDLLASVNALKAQTAQTAQDVKGGARPPQDLAGAALLRARFPGAAGNVSLQVAARLGQNVLVQDPANATKGKLRGVLAGDLVRIGHIDSKSAPGADADKLYIAHLSADGGDWHFSEDGTAATAKYWLNNPAGRKLDTVRNDVRIVTASVDLTQANKQPGESWGGLAFQPGHTRNGAADALTDKFSWAPTNGNDARTLAVAILLQQDIKTARDVFGALLQRSAGDVIEPKNWPVTQTYQLEGGNDGQRPGADEYAGRGDGPDAPKTGLKAFADIEDISIVAAPGSTYLYESEGYQSVASQITSSLIAHAELLKYRVAVLDSGEEQNVGQVRSMRAKLDTKYAAMYYPWIKVRDPVTDAEINLPPSGFVAGIYARNDIERAVYKAPANEVVRSAIGFETLLNKAQQEVLNPEGVNCFRYFAGRGFRLWGARTASSDPEWKYISVRRYFVYLEHSIDRGTQWAVFEPNGERLWANVRETISDFLYNEWRNGALLGTQAEKAYFVKCDRSTMTQNDLDNGRLVCQIGVAVIKPAEFVIFRIGQWTADSKL